MLQPKYEIGQLIFFARSTWGERKIKCPDCLGTKEWKVVCPSGEEFQHSCSTCSHAFYATGTVSEYDDLPKVEALTVGSIQINTADEDPVKYMCRETGVGSGSVYPETQLFATVEEANTFAKAEVIRVKGVRQAEALKELQRNKKRGLYKPKKETK